MDVLKRIWLVLFILVSLVAIGFYLLQETQHIEIPLHFAVSYISGIFFLQIIFWLMASAFWRQVIHLLHPTAMSLMHSFLQLMMVSVGKYLPGKIWGMFARGTHMVRSGITKRDVLLATFYEQTILLHSSVVLIGICLSYLYRSPVTLTIAALLCASIFIGPTVQRLSIMVAAFIVTKLKRGQRIEHPPPIGTASYSIFICKYALLWAMSGLIFGGLYLTFFQAPVSTEMLAGMLLANTAGVALGFFAVFAPGGIGVREAITSAILYNFMPLADAVLLSFLFRIWSILMDVLGALVILWFETKSAAGT